MHFNDKGIHEYLRLMITYLFLQYLCIFLSVKIFKPDYIDELNNSVLLSNLFLAVLVFYVFMIFAIVRYNVGIL